MKPTLTFVSATRSKLSNVSGCSSATVTYSCDKDLEKFEARATRSGATRGRGIGDLVAEVQGVPAGGSITFTISASSITQGDGIYVISLWGLADGVVFDFGDVDFTDLNFGEAGEWNDG